MNKNKTAKATHVFEKEPTRRRKEKYLLRLYVAGATARSQQAIQRARILCESALNGDYKLEIIDIYQQPTLARDGQILAVPTLVKVFPMPMRRLIGNLAETAGFFAGLDIAATGKAVT